MKHHRERPPRVPRPRRAASVLATLWTAAAAVWVPAAAAAQVPPAAPATTPPSFFIESIAVEGVRRVSAELVTAESLLTPGRAYDEEELRLAAYRVQRLPFVLEARFSLRKGSERDAYELVIAVEETRRFFFGAEIRGFQFSEPVSLDIEERVVPGLDRSAFGLARTAGVRGFLGAHGVAFAALTSGEGVQAGYSHYDLLGRRIVASAGWARQPLCCTTQIFPLGLDPSFTRWSLRDTERLSLELAFPVSGSHSLRLGVTELSAGEGDRGPVVLDLADDPGVFRDSFPRFRHRRAELRWVYDTTDDPVLPSRGRVASAGVVAATLTTGAERSFSLPGGGSLPTSFTGPALDTRWIALVVSGEQLRPLTSRQTVRGGVHLTAGSSRVDSLPATTAPGAAPEADTEPRDLTAFAARAEGGYALDLLTGARARTVGELRLEIRAGFGCEGTSPDLAVGLNPVRRLDLGVGLVLRNPWGIFRLSFSFVDFLGAEG